MSKKIIDYKTTYNYCRICGRQPQTGREEPNYGPIRFWEPDDGWIIGTLCRWCFDEFDNQQPHPDDYAYDDYYDDVATHIDTDEDPLLAF